jgi:hypothetical protein
MTGRLRDSREEKVQAKASNLNVDVEEHNGENLCAGLLSPELCPSSWRPLLFVLFRFGLRYFAKGQCCVLYYIITITFCFIFHGELQQSIPSTTSTSRPDSSCLYSGTPIDTLVSSRLSALQQLPAASRQHFFRSSLYLGRSPSEPDCSFRVSFSTHPWTAVATTGFLLSSTGGFAGFRSMGHERCDSPIWDADWSKCGCCWSRIRAKKCSPVMLFVSTACKWLNRSSVWRHYPVYSSQASLQRFKRIRNQKVEVADVSVVA